MFILKRVARDGHYSVFSCDSYRVEHLSPDETKITLMFREAQGEGIRIYEPDAFFLDRGVVCYVMNDRGQTIDTIDLRPCVASGSGSYTGAVNTVPG